MNILYIYSVHVQLPLTIVSSLGSGNRGLVEALPTLVAARHPGQVDPATVDTLPPAKRVHSKVPVAERALLAPLEHLGSTEGAGLFLASAEGKGKGGGKERGGEGRGGEGRKWGG